MCIRDRTIPVRNGGRFCCFIFVIRDICNAMQARCREHATKRQLTSYDTKLESDRELVQTIPVRNGGRFCCFIFVIRDICLSLIHI